jgi:hypothetical protein
MKKWYTSKTLWVNVIAVAAIVAQGVTGKEVIGVETQAVILGAINFALRIITKESVTW